jgi:Bacteriophage Lambda NinG protein
VKVKTTKASIRRAYGLERPSSPRWKTPELKGIAWEFVRRFVRHHEKDCYTCEKKNLIEEGYEAATGHYMPVAIVGSNNTRSWDKRFIHLQCKYCNGPGQGIAVEYRRHLVADYGEAVVKDFDDNYRKISPVKNWQAVIDEYRLDADGGAESTHAA